MKIYKKFLSFLTILFLISYPILPSYGTINLDFILIGILLLQLLGVILFKEERLEFKENIRFFKEDKIILVALALNLLMYISSIYSVNTYSTLINSFKFTLFIGLYLTIGYKFKNSKESKILLTSFLTVSVLSSFVSIYQAIKLSEQNLFISKDNRIISFLENSNILGAYSIFSVFIFIMLIFSSKKLYQKIIFSLASLLLTSNIILSQSRNALLGLILGLVLLSFLYKKRFIIYSVILSLILFIIPQSQHRLLQIFDMSQNSGRIKIFGVTLKMIKDNLLFGTGYESYGTLYPIYIKKYPEFENYSYYRAIHPHNALLKFQTELGILGLILLIAFIIITILTLLNEIKVVKDKESRNIIIGITISFIVFNFMNLMDNFYNILKVSITLFISLGIFKNYSLRNSKNYNLIKTKKYTKSKSIIENKNHQI